MLAIFFLSVRGGAKVQRTRRKKSQDDQRSLGGDGEAHAGAVEVREAVGGLGAPRAGQVLA